MMKNETSSEKKLLDQLTNVRKEMDSLASTFLIPAMGKDLVEAHQTKGSLNII